MLEFVAQLNWMGLSESCLRQGRSGFTAARHGERSFSPKVKMTEDFSLGMGPQFNDRGELSPNEVILIQNGRLENAMMNRIAAKIIFMITPAETTIMRLPTEQLL